MIQKSFFTLIRWPNILAILCMQIILFYGYILPFCSPESKQNVSFMIMAIATGAILAGGNIFNDIRDIAVDHLHPRKKKIVGNEISVTIARRWYYILNTLAITGGILILFISRNAIFAGIFPLTIFLLIFYSARLKNSILIGNLIIAGLCSLAVFIPALLPSSCSLSRTFLPEDPHSIIFHGYVLNAFFILLLREIIKDKEDFETDSQCGLRTVGELDFFHFSLLFYGLILIPVGFNGYGMYLLYPHLSFIQIAAGLLILFLPIIYIAIIFPDHYKKNYFHRLSYYLKIYILLAVLLLLLWL